MVGFKGNLPPRKSEFIGRPLGAIGLFQPELRISWRSPKEIGQELIIVRRNGGTSAEEYHTNQPEPSHGEEGGLAKMPRMKLDLLRMRTVHPEILRQDPDP